MFNFRDYFSFVDAERFDFSSANGNSVSVSASAGGGSSDGVSSASASASVSTDGTLETSAMVDGDGFATSFASNTIDGQTISETATAGTPDFDFEIPAFDYSSFDYFG